MLTVTKNQARQFILLKQGLLGDYRFIRKDGAYQFVRQAGCIQFDPVDVCGRNAELTLQSRVKGFRRKMLNDLLYRDRLLVDYSDKMLNDLLYRDRLLVDYSDKELSIWPREDWPFFSDYRERSVAHGRQFPGIPELEEQAIAYIRKHGPVSSDTLPIEGTVFWHSSMHWSGHWEKESLAARSVLEQLYRRINTFPPICSVPRIPAGMRKPSRTGVSAAGSGQSVCSGTAIPPHGSASA